MNETRTQTAMKVKICAPARKAGLCYSQAMNPAATMPAQNFMLRLREALEASWDRQTAYGAVEQAGNPALGQCYPTCRVVQHYYPASEVIKGKVWTGAGEEVHFWNVLKTGDEWFHIDLSWQQFPARSVVRDYAVLDRHNLGDSEATIQRCALLLKRVEDYLRKV